MKEFIIFIREDMSRMAQLTEEEFQVEVQKFTDWTEEMAKHGNYISGDPLAPEGKYIRTSGISSDGPFIEAKEAISGYVMIKAAGIEQAQAFAEKCPIFEYGGCVELRPIIKM